MAGVIFVVAALFIQSISSQVIQLQQLQQPTCQSQILTEQSILQQLPSCTQPNVVSDYSIELCKNLATAVQNMVLNKLTQSAYKKPIFNQIAGPLLNDIALRTQTQCPVCGNSNQNLVSTPTLGNQLAAYQSFVNPLQGNQYQTLVPLQSNQVQALVNPVQSVGNQVQLVSSYGNLNQVNNCPCSNLNGQALRLPSSVQNVLNVQNQGAQQKYSEAIAILESLKNGDSCGCGKRSGFSLF